MTFSNAEAAAPIGAWVSPSGWRRVPRLMPLGFIALIALCAVAGDYLEPHDPNVVQLLVGVHGPDAHHWLGTDDSGRDIFSRVVAGTRAAVIGPALIALGAAVVSTLLGLLAGYRGGWVDDTIMRLVDLMYAIPGLLATIVLLGVFGGGYYTAVLVLIVLTWPSDTRLIRGATLEQRSRPYVDSARMLGLSRWRIMTREILPNIIWVIVATAFLDFASSLISLSAISFLGIAGSPGAADWGRMISDNLSLINTNSLSVLGPALALVLTSVSMNLLGDQALERFTDRGTAA